MCSTQAAIRCDTLRYVWLCILNFCVTLSLRYIHCCCLVSLRKNENLYETGDWWMHETLFSGTCDTAFKTSTCPDQTLYSPPCGTTMWEVEGLQNFTKGDNTQLQKKYFSIFFLLTGRDPRHLTWTGWSFAVFNILQPVSDAVSGEIWLFKGHIPSALLTSYDILRHRTTSYDIVFGRLCALKCLKRPGATSKRIAWPHAGQRCRPTLSVPETPGKNQEDAMFCQDGIILNLLNHIHNLLHI